MLFLGSQECHSHPKQSFQSSVKVTNVVTVNKPLKVPYSKSCLCRKFSDTRLKLVMNYRDITKSALWTVSTVKGGYDISLMFDNQTDTFWQSDSVPPHWIGAQFSKKTFLSKVSIYLAMQPDDTYTPIEMAIYTGDDPTTLTELKKEEPQQFQGWVDIELNTSTIFLKVMLLKNYRAGKDSLKIAVNGKDMCAVPSSGKSRHSVAVLFGASEFGRFATSDAAPVTLKDLSFCRDGRRTFSWQLASADELARYRNIRLSVLNPMWMLDLNRRWHSEAAFFFPSKAFTVPDPERHRLLIVSEDTVTEYDLITGSSETHSYSYDMKLGQISNDFFVFPDGRLAYLDLSSEIPEIIFFDFKRNEWDRPSSKKGQSRYLHHSTFFNNTDSSVVQLFGYGYHKYSNEIIVWKPGQAESKTIYAENIGPRYMSAVGLTDSLA